MKKGEVIKEEYLNAERTAEAATGGVLQEKMFLEISRNSQGNFCARVSFLIKLQAKKRDYGTGIFLGILQNF